MRRLTHSAAWLLLVAFTIAGCAQRPVTDTSESSVSTADLVASLRQQGMVLQASGPTLQPFFSVPGEEYSVTGVGTLQLYEYNSETGAVLDANRVDIGGTSMGASPYVYRRGNVIAVYLGNNETVRRHLSTVLGARIM